jgi:hypothetical protein
VSDARDAARDARARIKAIAGRILARKEAAEAEVARLERARATSDDPAALDDELALQREALLAATRDLEEVLGESAELLKAERAAERAEPAAVLGGSSAEDSALARVREHIEGLAREAEHGDSGSPARAPSEDPKVAAQRQLAELKAARDRAARPPDGPAARTLDERAASAPALAGPSGSAPEGAGPGSKKRSL